MKSKGRPQTLDHSFEKDQYVKSMFNGLSPQTQANYVKSFPRLLDFIKMTPSEMIAKRLADTKSEDLTVRSFFENEFLRYKDLLEKTTKSHGTVLSHLKTMASFFSRNHLPLNLARGSWECTNPLHKGVISTTKAITQEDAKRLYGFCKSSTQRSLFLVLYQSGFSEVDVANLRIEDVKEALPLPEVEHFYIKKPRTKSGEIQETCLSNEALHDIRIMLQERNNPTEGYLFVSSTKHRGEQIESRTINESIRGLFERCFGAEKARSYKTKSLRTSFNSALMRAELPTELKEILMGHTSGVKASYSHDETTIKEAYAKAFSQLSVNGIQVKTDLAKFKSETETKLSALTDIIATQAQKIDELKALLTKNGIEFSKFVTAQETLNAIVERKLNIKQKVQID